MDKINPMHYRQGDVECIEAIESATKNMNGTDAYFVGNIIKYTWRFPLKNGIEDLEKAQWYLNRLLNKKKKEIVEEIENLLIEETTEEGEK